MSAPAATPEIHLDHVSKIVCARPAAARPFAPSTDLTLDDRAGRARRAARQDRMRQVDDLQHDRRAGRAQRRPGAGAGPRSVSRIRLVPRQDRDRVPERSAAAVAHRDRQCRARARHAGCAARERGANARSSGSIGSAWRATSTTIRTRSPAACASASRIARAFATDAPILLCDEPFSALDEITAQRLREEFVALVRAEPQDGGVHHPFDQRGAGGRRPHRRAAAAGANRLRRAVCRRRECR